MIRLSLSRMILVLGTLLVVVVVIVSTYAISPEGVGRSLHG